MHVAVFPASRKPRDVESIGREVAAELGAWLRGVAGKRCHSVYRNLRRAWAAGRRFAWQHDRGLRPLDTVRRKEAGRP